jgi:cytidylate kinase
MANVVITIDGPAASGKSTLAKLIAGRIGATFLDTGAMYRAVTLAAMLKNVPLENTDAVFEMMGTTEFEFKAAGDKTIVYVDGKDVTEDIRRPDVTEKVRFVASAAKLRGKLVELQRDFALQYAKVVTEGRDQGTVAFPNATVKFFMTADEDERARRRQAELIARGQAVEIQNTQAAITARDESDKKRTVGPLLPAEDAILIDTTNLSIEQVLEKMLLAVEAKI